MKQLVEVYRLEVHNDTVFQNPPQVMGFEEFDYHPLTQDIISTITKFKGTRATVIKSYKLV